jgi:hypothetical protein
MGVLSKEHVKHANAAPLIKSEIDHFVPTGVVLKNGKQLTSDYVVCCTGYKTGVDKIAYEVDNHAVQWQATESLFEGIVSPVMPRMVFAHANPYDLGMKRAVCLADHVMSMLVRFPHPDGIKNTTFGSRSCSMTHGVNMDPKNPMIVVFLTNWLMLIAAGVLSLYNMIGHMIGIFTLTRVRFLQLNHPQAKRP